MIRTTHAQSTPRAARRGLLLALSAALALAANTGPAAAGETTRVSVGDGGTEASTGAQGSSAIDRAGRTVSFSSTAAGLVDGDANGVSDVFVRDRKLGVTQRVSVDSTGAEANDDSSTPALSANGQLVAFESDATNLVSGDLNGVRDIFVRDRKKRITTRVSVDSAGAEANGASSTAILGSNGRYVAFSSSATNLVGGDGNGLSDVFVHDLKTGATTRVSVDASGAEGNGDSVVASNGALSATGSLIPFQSKASNLVAGDTNGKTDAFVHDTKTGKTFLVSVDSDGNQANAPSGAVTLSANGRLVAFTSTASNLVAGDTNGLPDIFVHDLKTGVTTRVSVDSNGVEANGESLSASFSANGRYVAFVSVATNLVAGDTNHTPDVFVHDLKTGATTRVSVDGTGAQSNGPSLFSALSGNGRFVALRSGATNLVTDDANGHDDIFVHDLKD